MKTGTQTLAATALTRGHSSCSPDSCDARHQLPAGSYLSGDARSSAAPQDGSIEAVAVAARFGMLPRV